MIITKKRILCQYARLNPYETLGYIRVDASGTSSSRERVKALVDDLAAFDPDLAGEEEIAKVREMLDAFARQLSAQPLILSLRS